MPNIAVRGITKQEAETLRSTLERAAVDDACRQHLAGIDALLVHEVCECGCASIGFLPASQKAPSTTRLLADGHGRTAEDVEVGLLVYGTEDCLVYLEIYSWDATPASLPLADTIGPFE
jgi:hypothetical protein